MPEGSVEWVVSISNTDANSQVDLIQLNNVEYEFWSPGRFAFTVPNDDYHRNIFLSGTGYSAGKKTAKFNRIVNKENSYLKFIGPVERVRANNDLIQVSGRGSGAKISRYYTNDNIAYVSVPLNQVVSQVCDGTGIRLGETGPDAPNVTCLFYAENKWRAIMDTVKNFAGWEAYVETDNTITLKSEVGTDKTASFTMQYGYNVISDGYREVDYEQLATRVRVRGEGEGFNQIKASAVNSDAETTYWEREIVYDDRSINNQDYATNVANYRLSATDSPRDQITLQTTEAYDPKWTVGLGDTVLVDWPRLALHNTEMRVKKLSYKWDTGGEVINMDLGEKGRNITRAMAGTNPGIRQEVEHNARHPQGATNIWQISKTENCDQNYPLIIPFYIPPEVKKINKAKINIRSNGIKVYQNYESVGDFIPFYRINNYYVYPGMRNYITKSFTNAPWFGLHKPQNVMVLEEETGYGEVFRAVGGKGTCGWAIQMHLRPHSWVDCDTLNETDFTGYTVALKQGANNLYLNDSERTTPLRHIIDDGHSNWHTFMYYIPRNSTLGDPTDGVSWIFYPNARNDSYSTWDYYWEIWDINQPASNINIETGIYEDTYDRLSVTVYIKQKTDGAYQKIWRGSVTTSSPLTMTDISFTEYVTSGTWHYLKAEFSDKCQGEMEGYIEGYVQSR